MLLRCNKTSPRAATLNANFIRGSMQERHLSMQMTELRISKLRLVPAKCAIAEVGFCAVTSIQMWKPFSSWIQQRRRRRTLAFVVVSDSWNSHCSTIWRYECCESKLDRNKNTEFISHKRTAKCDPLLLKYPTVSTPTGNKDLHFIYLSFLNTQPSCLSVIVYNMCNLQRIKHGQWGRNIHSAKLAMEYLLTQHLRSMIHFHSH